MAGRKKETAIQGVIFDTDILIWYLHGNQKARDFINGFPYEQRTISIFSYLELLQGCLNKKELRTIKEFIENSFDILAPVNEADFNKALLLMEKYVLSHRLGTIDALITATAITNKLRLATSNRKHYHFIAGIEILQFKP